MSWNIEFLSYYQIMFNQHSCIFDVCCLWTQDVAKFHVVKHVQVTDPSLRFNVEPLIETRN